MKRKTLSIPEDLHARIEKLAKERGMKIYTAAKLLLETGLSILEGKKK